jgi:hypothetical protein
MGTACGEMGSHSCCENAQINAQPAVLTSGVTPSISPAVFPLMLTGAALDQVSFTATAIAATSPPLLEHSSVVLRI